MLKQMQREHVHAKLEKRVRDLEKQMRPTSSVVISKDTLVSFRFYRKSTDMSTQDLLGRYKRRRPKQCDGFCATSAHAGHGDQPGRCWRSITAQSDWFYGWRGRIRCGPSVVHGRV